MTHQLHLWQAIVSLVASMVNVPASPGPPMTVEECRAFVANSHWKYAKSMPNNPHYYTLRDQSQDETVFVRFVLHIRQAGYRKRFGKTTYSYLDLDGWQYWTMGAPIGPLGGHNPNIHTTLINRAELNPAPSPQRRLL